MILLPGGKNAQRIIDNNSRRWTDKTLVFTEPLGTISSIRDLYAGGTGYLTGDIYSSYIIAAGNAVTITVILPAAQYVDALIIGDTNADYLSGKFYNGSDVVRDCGNLRWISSGKEFITESGGKFMMFSSDDGQKTPLERRLAPEAKELDVTDQKIIVYGIGDIITRAELTFEASAPVTLHKLWLANAMEFIADPMPQYEYIHNGNGQWTDYGVVYGTNYAPSIRTVSMKRESVDDIERRVFEQYINKVKNNRPHFIVPCIDADMYIPPFFGAITEAKIDNKKTGASWFWSGVSIKWRQCS